MTVAPLIDPLVLLLLAVMAFGVEKRYTGRLTVMANFVILWTTFWPHMSAVGDIFALWIWISAIAALIAIASYLNGFALEIHDAFFLFYSSKTVLGVLLATALGLFDYSIIFVIGVWFVAVHFLGHRIPFASN